MGCRRTRSEQSHSVETADGVLQLEWFHVCHATAEMFRHTPILALVTEPFCQTPPAVLIADAETRLCNAALTFQVTADAGPPRTVG